MSERPPPERRADLLELYRQLSPDWVCPLKGSRTNVVFGSGNADAELMFVGGAPGASEDREGKPFVGNAGRGNSGGWDWFRRWDVGLLRNRDGVSQADAARRSWLRLPERR